jgi:hypothetical protein
MAETEAQIGYGTLLQLGGGSPETFTTIAEIKEIGGFGFTRGLLEATHMESPNGYKEYVSDLKDGDTITGRANLVADNQTVTKTMADSDTRKNFQIVLPGDLTGYSFSGVPVAWHIQGMTPGGILEVTFGLKISGAIADLPALMATAPPVMAQAA